MSMQTHELNDFGVRMWNKKEKTFLFNVVFTVDKSTCYMDGSKNINIFVRSSQFCKGVFNTNEVEIERCSGLTDKEKTSIYEGDYLLCPDYEKPIEVKYMYGKFVLSFDDRLEDLYLYNSNSVIIGNIQQDAALFNTIEKIKLIEVKDFLQCEDAVSRAKCLNLISEINQETNNGKHVILSFYGIETVIFDFIETLLTNIDEKKVKIKENCWALLVPLHNVRKQLAKKKD